MTRTPPTFVERTIRTVKERIAKRITTFGGAWTKYLPDVLEWYDEKKHSTTEMAPKEAIKIENKDKVKENIEETSTWNRSLPNLKVGDKVKLAKKKGTFTDNKFDFNSWTDEVFTIVEVIPGEQIMFRLDRNPPRQPTKNYLRSELRLIKDAQKPVLRRARKKEPAPFIARGL